MTGPITARQAKAIVHERTREVAFLDIREHGQYGEGHPFIAVSCPFSRLEEKVRLLVPRLAVSVVLLDQADGTAERAASLLTAMGYGDVAWINGGAQAWQRANFNLFKGVNVPSKTLGELVEHEWHVPRIGIDDFAAMVEGGHPFQLFDARPASEHRKMRIPGAISLPNAELPHRFRQAVADPDVPVIIHCAGRTRSIIGAAGLALAGVSNPVLALENGTQGWALSGRLLDLGAIPQPLHPLDAENLHLSASRAHALMKERDIQAIDLDRLAELRADQSRTLYIFDVRTAEEFDAGSLHDAVHAPAVQLAQATDEWIGVRRARLVLVDDTGLRGAITAVFLRMLGYEVFVLAGTPLDEGSVGKTERTTLPLRGIDARHATFMAARGSAHLLDVRPSPAYRAGHLDGARWAIRPQIQAMRLYMAMPCLLAGPAELVDPVAQDLAASGALDIRRVGGDVEAWRGQGLDIIATSDQPSDAEAIDFLFFVHDRHNGNLEAARRYLDWETGLLKQLDAAERDEYRIPASPFRT
ncbi:rhodanese-like domain-containing protein [Tianweitania sp.]|uniref:rhodanese-like domain-containing protein n=1 Tax=Tianweitania sp. TaxID=2021634 RepID=UPI0028A2004D|nr:rhodanese-like domain-containing protein [Tianweitania sp.]